MSIIMTSILFLTAALSLFVFSIIHLFQKRLKRAFIFFLISIISFSISFVTSSLGQQVISIMALKYQISGDAEDGLKAYERMLNKKCTGAVLEKCSELSKAIEDIQICMFSSYGELSGECAMFLSNTPLNYPPLPEDKVVAGISFPKGSLLSMQKGYVMSAQIPIAWEFLNKRCAKGMVMFSHWEGSAENRIKVTSCNE